MRLFLLFSMLAPLFLVACMANKKHVIAEVKSDPTSSTYLADAGDRAKLYFYALIEKRNDFAKEINSVVRFVVMDARDSRLYEAGAPVQPTTAADKVLVRVAENGAFLVVAFILDRPGNLTIKESPTGNLVIDIDYEVEKITYSSRFDGLYASVGRNTSGNGWNYVYYVKGFGNQVTPVQFDNAVAGFLQNSVLYLTPMDASAIRPRTFAPAKNSI